MRQAQNGKHTSRALASTSGQLHQEKDCSKCAQRARTASAAAANSATQGREVRREASSGPALRWRSETSAKSQHVLLHSAGNALHPSIQLIPSLLSAQGVPLLAAKGRSLFTERTNKCATVRAAVDAFAARVPGSQPGATGSGHNWLRWSPAACNNADAVGGGCWTLRCLDSPRPASRCGGPAYFRVPAFDAVGGCYAHWPRYFARRKHVKQLRAGDGPCHGAAASARCRAGGRRR